MQLDITDLYMNEHFYKSTVERDVGTTNQNHPTTAYKNTQKFN